VFTYTRLSAGVDATVSGRNNAAGASVRYERRIGYDDNYSGGDQISGLVRASLSAIPQTLRIEAGALAQRTGVESSGAAIYNPLDDAGNAATVYSAYAGPSLRTRAGNLDVEADYRFGYTAVDAPDVIPEIADTGTTRLDVFDDSTVHHAQARIGSKPYDLLPVGVGVDGAWREENISNLDQRVRDRHVRADVTVPAGPSLAFVAGVGYEDVEVSHRDAVRDPDTGVPLIDGNGRFVTDESADRIIAYETDGIIWDAGVLWRPSNRTALEAHVGRRYGSTSVYGSLSYKPSLRSSLSVSVYDNVSGFGGQLNDALALMPTTFTGNRNPITGALVGCVDSLEGNNCTTASLSSLRSATFRARGVAAGYSRQIGRMTWGAGAGYDRRKFIAAPGTVLASANGVIDENVWLTTYLNGNIDARSGYSANLYANWFDTGFNDAGDATAVGASAAYYRNLAAGLSATAAVGIDGISREELLEDIWNASAQLGLRYSF
jgi:hypothetical protein